MIEIVIPKWRVQRESGNTVRVSLSDEDCESIRGRYHRSKVVQSGRPKRIDRKKLRRLWQTGDYTQEEIGKILGCTKSFVAKIISGERR